MGIDVYIETERGEKIEGMIDPNDVLHRLLPRWDDDSYCCLRFIDLYGDTVFNRLQLPVFLAEWERVNQLAKTEEERGYAENVAAMALRCSQQVHHYLKFYGD